MNESDKGDCPEKELAGFNEAFAALDEDNSGEMEADGEKDKLRVEF